MSDLTNYAENQLADFARGQGLGSLPGSFWIGFLDHASDSDAEQDDLPGTGLGRVEYVSSLANWSGTQGQGTTLASFGVSHATSNNVEINMGVASGDGEATAIGLFDAESGGNCWFVFRLSTPLLISAGDNPKIVPGTISFSLGLFGGMTDYLSNKLIDKLFRAQAYDWPASLFSMGFTSAPSNAGGGTEIAAGTGYARAEIVSSLGAWSSTIGPGDTGASTGGTSGRMSNNVALSHPLPTGIQGVWGWAGLADAASAGNLMFWTVLDNPRTVALGSNAPTYPPDTLFIEWR